MRSKNITKVKFAEEQSISKARVSQYLRAGMPVNADGTIPSVRARRWIKKNIDVPDEASDLTAARTRKESALAGIRELELKKQRGELLDKTEVSKEWSKLLTAFRNRMLLLIDKLTATLHLNAEQREIVRKQVYEVLTALGNYDPKKGTAA